MAADRLSASAGRGRRYFAPAIIALIAVVVLGACAPLPGPSQPAATGPFELTVLHTNDTWGYLDPCG